MIDAPETGTVYDRAIAIANMLNCRVAIVRNDCDGPGRHWEVVAEAKVGGFPHAASRDIADIILPADPRFLPR